jgi:hypothetical protein
MTRLAIGWLMVLATLLVGTICVYALKGKPDGSVILAIGTALATIAVKGIYAIKNRNAPDDK